MLILPIAGISYEVLKAAAKRDNLACRIARAPGLALQHLTTKEPTEDMLEVAIASFYLAMGEPNPLEVKENEPPEDDGNELDGIEFEPVDPEEKPAEDAD